MASDAVLSLILRLLDGSCLFTPQLFELCLCTTRLQCSVSIAIAGLDACVAVMEYISLHWPRFCDVSFQVHHHLQVDHHHHYRSQPRQNYDTMTMAKDIK